MTTTKLDPDTLASILEVESLGLMPLSAEQRTQAALEVRRAKLTASSDSPEAQGLLHRLLGVARILGDNARRRLNELPIVWIDSALPHAAVFEQRGTAAIMICRGLFDLVHFQTALNTVCSLLQRHERSLNWGTGWTETPSQDMNLAGHVIIADAYGHLRPPATVADLLGPKALHDVELGVSASLLLLLLHEIGHVDCEHTQRTLAARGIEVDVVGDPGSLGERERIELEADAYSIKAIAPEWRPAMLSSLINLHNVFHFFEIFGVRPSREYPRAANRIAAMIALMSLTEEDRTFAQSWVDDYRRREALIAAAPTTPADMLARFDATLDVGSAYATVRKVRQVLERENAVLEADEIIAAPETTASERPS